MKHSMFYSLVYLKGNVVKYSMVNKMMIISMLCLILEAAPSGGRICPPHMSLRMSHFRKLTIKKFSEVRQPQ